MDYIALKAKKKNQSMINTKLNMSYFYLMFYVKPFETYFWLFGTISTRITYSEITNTF